MSAICSSRHRFLLVARAFRAVEQHRLDRLSLRFFRIRRPLVVVERDRRPNVKKRWRVVRL